METTLTFLVDDLPAYIDRIEQAGGTVVDIKEPRPGIPVRMANAVDTEGNGFTVNQYVGERS